MYNHFQLAKKYFQYRISASNGKGHGIHSPFVFDFVQSVLNNSKKYESPINIEQRRKELLQDNSTIIVEDFGAGSRTLKQAKKKVKEIAKTAVKPPKYGQLLYRLVKHYQPQTIIELGTSLGITTTYLASANPQAQLITVEGSQAIAAIAKTNFQKLNLSNITLQTGNFDEVLPTIITQFPELDLAYIDGNHRLEPTLAYFNWLLKKTTADSILVFDDIHWSKEMEWAWQTIQQHPAVRCTIDIFFLGFVFFRDDFKEKQHFKIRF